MFYIHLSAMAGLLLLGFSFLKMQKGQDAFQKGWLAALFLAALSVRLAAAAFSKGFGNDTACFAAWADRIFQVGPSGFYSPDVFTDYPPGYMYVLWLLGAVRKIFGIGYYSTPHLILLKLPAIICDMACAFLLFREACGKCSRQQALFLCMAYLFNPVIILNSSVWGQVDSIYTLAIIYMCLCLVHRKMYSAYITFAVGILIKPQTLMFAPVLLAAIIDHVFFKDFSVKNLLHHLFQGLTAIGGMFILCLPFGLENVWKQYFSTVTSYPYAAVNACNIWGLFGLNWISQESTFLGIPYRIFGWTAILAAVALMLALSLRNRRDTEKYPFLGAFLLVTIFVFSVRMHERYLYPALLLLLFAYVYKPAKLTFFCYGGLSLMHFYNTAQVLFFYDPANYDRKNPLILLVSAGMLACAGLLFYVTYRYYRGAGAMQAGWNPENGRDTGRSMGRADHKAKASQEETAGHRTAQGRTDNGQAGRKPEQAGNRTDSGPNTPKAKQAGPFQISHRGTPLKKADFACMLILTLIYSCFALYDLGDRQAPSTTFDMTQSQTITLDFGSKTPAAVSYYIAPWHNRFFTLEGKSRPEDMWTSLGEVNFKNVFTWQNAELGTGSAGITILRLTLKDNQASLMELVFLDKYGNVLTPVNAEDYPALFDEAALRPTVSTFRNSMYFDEIYHGRTAYEFIHGLTSYENTHPPFGKILISLGVALFGMNPFGWRIIGVLFGIAMVPFVYLFARRISDSTLLAALACTLFTFDFMHFAQTRLATIDVYVTFFVILMYYFMYQYSQLSFYDTELKKTWLPLGACGVCMGFGVASKWTGIYAGAGLALIFFSTLYRRAKEYRFAKKNPSGSTCGISHKHVIEHFAPDTKRTVGFCMVFFVAVPALIYLLSYLPFRDYSDRALFDRMLYNQKTMFGYHSGLDSTHPYSSTWYEWPIMKRPIWYYSRTVTKTPHTPSKNLRPEADTGEANIAASNGTAKFPYRTTDTVPQPVDTGLREGISSFGNPAVWWLGIPAALHMVYLWFRKKDKNAAFLVIGYLAQYLPWFFVTRITFIYHYFPSVIFVVLMIMYSIMQEKENMSKRTFFGIVLLYGAASVILFLMFYPVLAGQPVAASYVAKYLRWFKSWVLTAK